MKPIITRSDRINRMIEQLDNDLSGYGDEMPNHWAPVNEPRPPFWQQDKSPYWFVLGLLLILLAIMPPVSHATTRMACGLSAKH